MTRLTHFSGTVYPDKTISIGVLPKKPPTVADRADKYPFSGDTKLDGIADFEYLNAAVEGRGNGDERESNLFIKRPESSQKKKKIYGRHGITTFGKRVCRNTALLLQQKYGRARLGFGTCTLPTCSARAIQILTANWANVVRRFYQTIRRKYERLSQQFIYVGVTEIQEKRFKRGDHPVPHLHFIFVAKRSIRSGYTCSTKDFYSSFNSAVNQVLALHGCKPIMGIDGHKGSVKVEHIKTSAASYIGKYISKGTKVVNDMIERGYAEFPRQWWTASTDAKALFKKSLIKLKSDDCIPYFYCMDAMIQSGLITWGKEIEVKIDNKYRKIGVIARLSSTQYDKIKYQYGRTKDNN